MKKWTKETWQILKLNIGNILLFEFLYRTITLPMYFKVVNQSLRFSLRVAGYSYLTTGNIGRFLIQPWTLIMLLLDGVLGLILLFVEIAGIITAYEGAAYAHKLSPLAILVGGVRKMIYEIKRKNILLFLLTAIDAIVIHMVLIYRLLTHIKPFNFILNEVMKGRYTRPALFVILIALIAVTIPTMFVLYGCLIEKNSFYKSFLRNKELLKGHMLSAMLIVGLCNLAVLAVFILIYIISVLTAAVFVVWFADKSMAMALLLSVIDRIEMFELYIAGIFLVVVNYAMMTVLYYQYSQRLNKEPKWNFNFDFHKTRDKRIIGVVSCVVTCFSLLFIFDLVRNGSTISEELMSEVQITAHRGSSTIAPENTISALEAAMEDMADYAEIDVQMTSDGVIVLCHDSNLKRTAGLNRSISSMTYEELEELDVGSWFSSDYAGERIPSLWEVMEICKGRLNLNIEIKNVEKNSELPLRVAELIQAFGMEEQCVVTSTSLNYLKQVKEVEGDIRTGYIISAAYGDFYSTDFIDFISIRSSFVDAKLVERAHEQGRAIYAWTVNKKSEMERMRMLQVDNIITDYPVLAREIIYRHEATETLLEYMRMALKH